MSCVGNTTSKPQAPAGEHGSAPAGQHAADIPAARGLSSRAPNKCWRDDQVPAAQKIFNNEKVIQAPPEVLGDPSDGGTLQNGGCWVGEPPCARAIEKLRQ